MTATDEPASCKRRFVPLQAYVALSRCSSDGKSQPVRFAIGNLQGWAVLENQLPLDMRTCFFEVELACQAFLLPSLPMATPATFTQPESMPELAAAGSESVGRRRRELLDPPTSTNVFRT